MRLFLVRVAYLTTIYIRICVGRWAADASLWIAMASILAVFQLGKAKDELGNEIEVTENYSDSIVWWVAFAHCFTCGSSRLV